MAQLTEELILQTLRQIKDPDLHKDIVTLGFIKDLKERRRGRLSEYAEQYSCAYLEGERPWSIPCDLAFPCATQNELDEADAKELIQGGCSGVIEGANMPLLARIAVRPPVKLRKFRFADLFTWLAASIARAGLDDDPVALPPIEWGTEVRSQRSEVGGQKSEGVDF